MPETLEELKLREPTLDESHYTLTCTECGNITRFFNWGIPDGDYAFAYDCTQCIAKLVVSISSKTSKATGARYTLSHVITEEDYANKHSSRQLLKMYINTKVLLTRIKEEN